MCFILCFSDVNAEQHPLETNDNEKLQFLQSFGTLSEAKLQKLSSYFDCKLIAF